MVLFDRSWYNRGVVEPVMGFCGAESAELFLTEAPKFEHMLTREGIHLFKFWLEIGREMQLLRFHQRRHSPLKMWEDFAGRPRGDRSMGRIHRRT